MTFTETIIALSFLAVIVAFITGIGLGLRIAHDGQNEIEDENSASNMEEY